MTDRSASPDLPRRLQELQDLEAGWLDGEGRPIDAQLLSALQAQWQAHAAWGLPAPYAYPTLQGGVLLEWNSPPPAGLSLEFEPKSTVAQALLDEQTWHLDFACESCWLVLKGILQPAH